MFSVEDFFYSNKYTEYSNFINFTILEGVLNAPQCIAIGYESFSIGANQTIAIGSRAESTDSNTIAFGRNTIENRSVILGGESIEYASFRTIALNNNL